MRRVRRRSELLTTYFGSLLKSSTLWRGQPAIECNILEFFVSTLLNDQDIRSSPCTLARQVVMPDVTPNFELRIAENIERSLVMFFECSVTGRCVERNLRSGTRSNVDFTLVPGNSQIYLSGLTDRNSTSFPLPQAVLKYKSALDDEQAELLRHDPSQPLILPLAQAQAGGTNPSPVLAFDGRQGPDKMSK